MLLSHSDDWDEIFKDTLELRKEGHRKAVEAGLQNFGMLAQHIDGVQRPLEVMESDTPGLFYLGTRHEGRAFTRESVELFFSLREAAAALHDLDAWSQESTLLYDLTHGV